MMNVAIPRDDAVVAEQLRTAPTPLALLRQTAAARPEHPAVVYLRSGNDPAPVVITYAQLLAEVEQAARAFHAAGVKETIIPGFDFCSAPVKGQILETRLFRK